jgi:hypothetical protein
LNSPSIEDKTMFVPIGGHWALLQHPKVILAIMMKIWRTRASERFVDQLLLSKSR